MIRIIIEVTEPDKPKSKFYPYTSLGNLEVECSICGKKEIYRRGEMYSVDKHQKYSCINCLKGK